MRTHPPKKEGCLTYLVRQPSDKISLFLNQELVSSSSSS